MILKSKIHNRLALVLWGAALLAFILAGTGVVLFQSLTLEHRARQIMEPYAQLVSVGTDVAVAFEDPVRAQEILDTLRANPQILEADIYLDSGRILASFSRMPNVSPRPLPTRLDGLYLSNDTAELLQALPRGGRLRLSMGLDQLSQQTHQALWIFGAGVLVLLTVTFAQLVVLRRTIVLPIANLTEATEVVRVKADYMHRVPASGADEVARLGQNFNAMMEAIKERENDLHRLTLLQRTILDNVAYGIISTTPDGMVTSFNPAAERLLGYTAEEIVGKQTPECWHDPKEVTRYALQLSEELDESIQPGFEVFAARPRRFLPEEGEWTFIRKDGGRIPVNLSVTALRDERGQITGFVGLTYDLTERKRAEAALAASEQQFRSLAENSPDNVVRYDWQCRARYYNPIMLQTLGVDPETILGKTPVELGAGGPESDIEFEGHIRQALESGESSDMELTLQHPGDGISNHLIRFAAERDTEGNITGVLAIGRDVTKLKQAELAHQASLHFFESMDRVNRAIQGANDLEQAMSDVLDAVLAIFDCDRVFLMYPCDPEAATWHVPMERNKAEYSSTNSQGPEIPMDVDVASLLRELLASDRPVKFGPRTEHPLQEGTAQLFGFLSFMSIAIYPKVGKPWQFGIHQCSYAREWTTAEEKLFQEIGRRLSDGLSSLLVHRELEASEKKYHNLFEESLDAMYIVTPEGNLIDANRKCIETFGYESREQGDFINLERDIYVNPADRQKVLSKVDTQGSTECELVLKKRSGDLMIALCAVTAERDQDGNIKNYRGTIRDITERRKADEQLRIAAIAFEAQEGIVITDANKVILRVNSAFTNITGYTGEDAVGQTPRLLQSGHHDAVFYGRMWEGIRADGFWQGEIWNRRKNGELYPEWLNITAVKNEHGEITHYVGTLTDITARKAAEEQIEQLAFYDPLTALPNRRLLLDRLQQVLASSGRGERAGALLLIDLDNFKVLNDTRGHSEGDLLLQQVAKRLVTCVREGDTVARLGGDEFVVILAGLSQHSVEAAEQTGTIAKKILATLSEPYRLADYEFLSTSSVGATLFLGNQQPKEDLLKQADISMYEAKKTGGNALRFFDRKMQETVNARAVLEKELRLAIEKHQFQLHYQVQVLSSRSPLGAEALLRWMHPERGMVSPARFIPLAEETGLILPIGQWVLETACAQIKAWQNNVLTRDLVIAVNVSAKQFHQADFVDQIKSLVQRHAINPALLKLELTESMLLDKIEETIACMNTLKEVGVQFSLDDFGTGYSSLQYLKRLPLDQIKIDQSFVRDIATDSSDTAIVRTIIAMAESLDIEVIAEGVETEEQNELLKSMDCIRCQGYLFGKPVPVEDFEKQLARG